jgi:hypothetical protein
MLCICCHLHSNLEPGTPCQKGWESFIFLPLTLVARKLPEPRISILSIHVPVFSERALRTLFKSFNCRLWEYRTYPDAGFQLLACSYDCFQWRLPAAVGQVALIASRQNGGCQLGSKAFGCVEEPKNEHSWSPLWL